jgi:hypothetical protein
MGGRGRNHRCEIEGETTDDQEGETTDGREREGRTTNEEERETTDERERWGRRDGALVHGVGTGTPGGQQRSPSGLLLLGVGV